MARFSSGFTHGLAGNLPGLSPTKRLPIDLFNRLDYAVKFLDFLDITDYETAADDPWAEDDIGTPTAATVILDDDGVLGAGGVLQLNAGTADSTGIQTQYTGASGLGEFVVPTDGKVFAFGCRLNNFGTGAASLTGLMVGLSVTDTTSLSTAGAVGSVDCVGFYSTTTSANVTLEARRSSGSGTGSVVMTTINGTASLGTWRELAFVCDVDDISDDANNGRIYGFRRESNGLWTLVGIIDNAIPNTNICLSLGAVNGIGTDADVALDYVWVAMER